MATNTMNGTVVSQAGYNGGWSDYGTKRHYAGHNSSGDYVCIVQLQTPAFVGASESLKVVFGAYLGYNSNPTLRYALCSSDANKSKYVGYADVEDANQLVKGVTALSGLEDEVKTFELTLATAELKPSTTYYLFLWAYSSSSMFIEVAEPSNHSVTVAYNAGVVYIDNGSGFDAYQCYIDNGSGWDLYIPYIDNGTEFVLYSG